MPSPRSALLTILLFGRTGAGKTAQVAELAEHIVRTTGKRTRVYTCDRGGVETIRPWIDAGIIDVVEQDGSDIWVFMNKATHGCVRDTSGKWVPGNLDNIGLVAFESMKAFCDELMRSMTEKAKEGVNIGGGANISFSVTGDGETLKVGGSNMAMYGVGQSAITQAVWDSQKLPVDYLLWTSSVSKDEDGMSSTKVIGPDVLGKALTAEVPRWFDLSFRIDVTPANGPTPEKHILYLGTSTDVKAGNATVLGNLRMPLGSKPLPTQIEPASLVGALQMITKARQEAAAAITSRIKL